MKKKSLWIVELEWVAFERFREMYKGVEQFFKLGSNATADGGGYWRHNQAHNTQEWGSISNIFPRLVNESRDCLNCDRSDYTLVCPGIESVRVGINVIAYCYCSFHLQSRPLFRILIITRQGFVGLTGRHTKRYKDAIVC